MIVFYLFTGNNHLGGQDFNQRLLHYIQSLIREKYGKEIADKEDLQLLRLHVEEVKLNLTSSEEADINLSFHSLDGAVFRKTISRTSFEDINMDLFKKVLEPISVVLNVLDLSPDEVDEIVLVGGSTRIPKIRQLIRDYFRKDPNVAIDPELAVAMGVSIQAGILGGMWPLSVSAVELPIRVKKIHIH